LTLKKIPYSFHHLPILPLGPKKNTFISRYNNKESDERPLPGAGGAEK
jgi:hypothetical protein